MTSLKTENTKITETNIKELFNGRVFEIPIYQRGYAWERPEVEQLVQDIQDSMNDGRFHYFIGNVVTYRLPESKDSKPVFQVIDGQQRLTTIYLLLCALKKLKKLWNQEEKPALIFENRTKSSNILDMLWNDCQKEYDESDSSLINAFRILGTCLKRIENYNQLDAFTEYLEKNVIILISEVPSDTDLNHYFEIMNSRGEQLEQHEIIKAHCIARLKDNPFKQKVFGMIWDAVSDMRRYVQYGFKPEIRKQLFGASIDNLTSERGNAFYQLFDVTEIRQADGNTKDPDIIIGPESCLEEIDGLRSAADKANSSEDEAPERFYSVIDFKNFLMHVLKIFVYGKQQRKEESVPLDDKKIIQAFDQYMQSEDVVSDFGEFLLRARYMFDCYVIKREWLREKERWSLKRLHFTEERHVSYKFSFSGSGKDKDSDSETSDDKNDLVKIQSMFHVSFPSMLYKYWLNGILKWLLIDMDGREIKEDEFLGYLENMAAAFMFDRYTSTSPLDFDTIIYTNNSKPIGNKMKIDFPDKLNQGTDVELFVFNYLDYLLWKAKTRKVYTFYPDESIDPELRSDSKIDNFEFVSRSSVEHYYPQNPLSETKLSDDKLNSFGNLCLISRSKNSKLSNFLPEAKKEHYKNADRLDSIKQRIMMAYPEWGVKEIDEHQKAMFSLFEATLEDIKAKNQQQA